MAPSASLQARIAAFENLSISPKRIPPNILDSDPMSPTSDSLLSFPPLTPSFNPPRSSSPPVLGRKTSLIDFSELSASPRLKNDGLLSTDETGSASVASDKPPLPPRSSPRIPPLPPRKPSQNSLKNWLPTKGPIPIPLPVRSSPISIASSQLLFHPDSLSSDLTHPASNSSDGSSRHLPASSISSFQSVSLSSEGLGTTDNSLDGSYEAVSSTAATSPVSKESHNPSALSLIESSSTLTRPQPQPQPQRRRPAPPPPTKPAPPPSVTQQLSPTALLRPVPIPVNARKRYDALFERYTLPLSSQKGRATSGWRGPSLDLLTGFDVDDSIELNARIDGSFVKSIWVCSKLPRSRLKEIWNECDINGTGSLDRYAFALGMWRIDEALRAAHQSRDFATKSSPTLPRRTPHITYVPRPPPTRRTSQK